VAVQGVTPAPVVECSLWQTGACKPVHLRVQAAEVGVVRGWRANVQLEDVRLALSRGFLAHLTNCWFVQRTFNIVIPAGGPRRVRGVLPLPGLAPPCCPEVARCLTAACFATPPAPLLTPSITTETVTTAGQGSAPQGIAWTWTNPKQLPPPRIRCSVHEEIYISGLWCGVLAAALRPHFVYVQRTHRGATLKNAGGMSVLALGPGLGLVKGQNPDTSCTNLRVMQEERVGRSMACSGGVCVSHVLGGGREGPASTT
jgi:hypothetical protein